MKRTISTVIITLLVVGLTGLNSCKSCSEQKQKQGLELEQKDSLEKEIEANVYPLPTSAEVIKMLTDLEVGFIMDITNPVENVKRYFTSSARAINLGVYGADLSYATLYNMSQDVINYMDAIRTLANDLNMSKIYNAPLYDSIKANFDDRDKLVNILTDAFNDTYLYMTENDQQNLALLVVGGAWVEGMFLTTNVTEAAYNDPNFAKVLIEQKESFELFIDITKPYLEDSMIGEFVAKLDPIKKVYAGLTTSLTSQNIKDITAAIANIRNQIIL